MGLIAINVWFSGYRLTARGSSLQLFPMKPSWQSNHYLKYIRAIDYKQTFCLLNRYSYMALSWSVKVKVTQSGLTLCDPMDSTVHRILQARKLEWVAFPFSRGSSQSRNWTQVSHIAGRFFFFLSQGKPRKISDCIHILCLIWGKMEVCDVNSTGYITIKSVFSDCCYNVFI